MAFLNSVLVQKQEDEEEGEENVDVYSAGRYLRSYTFYSVGLLCANCDSSPCMHEKVGGHLGDKPTGRQPTGRQHLVNWTTNY